MFQNDIIKNVAEQTRVNGDISKNRSGNEELRELNIDVEINAPMLDEITVKERCKNKEKKEEQSTSPPEQSIQKPNTTSGDVEKEAPNANIEKELIDIDEFLLRSGECSTFQFHLVMKMMLMSIPLSYPIFIFYFISYDPPWINVVSSTSHTKEDNTRCSLNRTEWIYDYDKTTLTTEVSLYLCLRTLCTCGREGAGGDLVPPNPP